MSGVWRPPSRYALGRTRQAGTRRSSRKRAQARSLQTDYRGAARLRLTCAPSRACFAATVAQRGLMRSYLDFEKPVAELEAKVEELRAMAATGDAVAVGEEIAKLEAKASAALADLYA